MDQRSSKRYLIIHHALHELAKAGRMKKTKFWDVLSGLPELDLLGELVGKGIVSINGKDVEFSCRAARWYSRERLPPPLLPPPPPPP